MLLAALFALQSAAAERPQPCTQANSTPATIADVTTQRRLVRRCVAVTGLYRRGALIVSTDTLYLPGISWAGDPDREPAYRQLLILRNGQLPRRLPRDGVYRATAFGRVGDCEEIRQANQASAGPDEIVMTTGLCHYLPGAFLQVPDPDVVDLVLAFRLTGEAQRARVGDLIPPPEAWQYRTFVEDHAGRYLRALRGGDRAALLALHMPGGRPEQARAGVRLAFGQHSGFTAIRTAPTPPQVAIFIEDAPGPATWSEGFRGFREYSSTICFCREAGCTERWPISVIDADNREDRPYVCMELGSWVMGSTGRAVPYFTTEQTRSGLPEP